MNIPPDILLKYPRATQFLQEHPNMTIDQCIEFLNNELKGECKNGWDS